MFTKIQLAYFLAGFMSTIGMVYALTSHAHAEGLASLPEHKVYTIAVSDHTVNHGHYIVDERFGLCFFTHLRGIAKVDCRQLLRDHD